MDTVSFVKRNTLSVTLPVAMMVAYNALLSRKEPMWTTQPMNIVLPLVLMIVLSPGIILSVPPSSDSSLLFSGKSSTATQLVVHAVVMVLALKVIRDAFPQFYSFSL